MTDKVLATLYVQGEGRPSLDACMEATFRHCAKYEVAAVVMYTSVGDGPCIAVDRYTSVAEFAHIRIVAVTPPAQRLYLADPREPGATAPVRTGIFGERRVKLNEAGVPVISARLPFRSLAVPPSEEASFDPMQLVDRAFGTLGGGFSLCVQAALLACDAGAVSPGERVAAMTADTSIVLLASHSENFLSPKHGLFVEHIICRPSLYDISKPAHLVTRRARAEQDAANEAHAQLQDASPAEPPGGDKGDE